MNTAQVEHQCWYDNMRNSLKLKIYGEEDTYFFIWKNVIFFLSSSSSSCRAASMDIPDPLSPLLPIIHRLWQVFRVTSCVLT